MLHAWGPRFLLQSWCPTADFAGDTHWRILILMLIMTHAFFFAFVLCVGIGDGKVLQERFETEFVYFLKCVLVKAIFVLVFNIMTLLVFFSKIWEIE